MLVHFNLLHPHLHAYLPYCTTIFILCIIDCLLFAILFCLDCEEDQGGFCDCADCAGCSDQGKWHSSKPYITFCIRVFSKISMHVMVVFGFQVLLLLSSPTSR